MTPLRSDWHRVGAGFSVRFAFSGERFDAQWRPRLPTRREFERVAAAKVGEQAEFVAWWEKSVRPEGRPQKTVTDHVTVSVVDLERATGIGKKQVSRWRARLKDTDGYIAKVVAAARKKAMDEAEHNHRAQAADGAQG
ncbi:MAG: hypothetical protein LKCHEGNO_03597 [Burkholderiaceae bacterium]|nr:hypothetical protein [Burkholderiaceae bacterium]